MSLVLKSHSPYFSERKLYSVSPLVMRMDKIPSNAPSQWHHHLLLKNGRPDQTAITLLKDIVYWYRPKITKDPETEQILYEKKFKADILQKDYREYETEFNFSKKQCRQALIRLEEKGVLKRHVRSMIIGNKKIGSCLFIEIFPEVIEQISHIQETDTLPCEERPLFPIEDTPLPCGEYPPSLEGSLYTINTSVLTTNNKTNARAREEFCSQVIQFPNKAVQTSPPPLKDPPQQTNPKKKTNPPEQEQERFESSWEKYREGAKKYDANSVGSKENAKRAFAKVLKKLPFDELNSRIDQYFEWKESLKQQGKFCETPPYFQKFLNQAYWEEPDLMEFIEINQKKQALERETTTNNIQAGIEIMQEIKDPKVREFYKELHNTLGEDAYSSWFRGTKLMFENKAAYLEARSAFVADRIKQNPQYHQAIDLAMKKVFPEIETIECRAERK